MQNNLDINITGLINLKEQNSKVTSSYVIKTIEDYLKTINKNKEKDTIIEVSFFGGTFTAIDINKQKELLKVAKEYKDKGLINYIRLSTRPDYISKDILQNLKDYSVDIIELGVQSLDEEVLFKSGRGHGVHEVTEATKLIRTYGFILGIQIMLGLPGDNFKKDIYTTKKVIELNPDICRIYPSLVIKDTPMEKMYKEGTYEPYDLEKAVQICKTVYAMLVLSKIKVIRVGLQPTEEISEGAELVAGPFHPAFRELVEGSLINDMLFSEIKEIEATDIEVHISCKDLSKLYTDKKKYFKNNIIKFQYKNIKIIQSKDLKRGEIVLDIEHKKSRNLNMEKYLNDNYLSV